MKKYIANTAISVSVTLPKGGNMRVSFSALTDGTSVYYTDDKEIEWALEHHYKYGKLFRLAGESQTSDTAPSAGKSTQKTTKSSKATQKGTPTYTTKTTEPDSENAGQEETATPREVAVTDLDAAKDYLAENFGVVRTKLKTEEIIKETALGYGITFILP